MGQNLFDNASHYCRSGRIRQWRGVDAHQDFAIGSLGDACSGRAPERDLYPASAKKKASP
jgi:hypothetical protein